MNWPRGFAVAALLLAALNTLGVITIEEPTIYLLLIALAAVALPEISKLSFGKDGFTFERFEAMKQDLASLKAGTAAAIENQVGGRLPATLKAPVRAAPRGSEENSSLAPSMFQDEDPQLGQWGGSAQVAGRRLFAKVTPSPLRSDWFDVALTVEATDRARPLEGTVVFHLHPTFTTPRSRPVINGRATLNLIAWGAFTVGAEADGGQTRLELNLANVDAVPEAFRQH